MIILALWRHPAAVFVLSPTAGVMYATLFTMPYLLVAHYHNCKTVSSYFIHKRYKYETI